MRSTPGLVLPILLAAAAAGCQLSPTNGAAFSGNVVGKTITFQGFWNEPNQQIRLEVMKNPTLNPASASSWTQFATATTDDEPVDLGAPGDPIYSWDVTAAPVPNAMAAARWPQGGLVRVRAVHVGTGQKLTTFDASNDCLGQQYGAGADWAVIGQTCAGVGNKTAALVSTSDVPSGGFLTRKPELSVQETEDYYDEIDAPPTFLAFRNLYGFDGTELKATYYNDGDLGLGRDMHCKAYADPDGTGVACYVTNYSGIAGVAAFNQPFANALADAVAHSGAFATVAMVADPPFNQGNSVKFMVYGSNGVLSPQAALDSTGEQTSVPTNCMSCHGINSTYNDGVVTGAQFLPFDPFSFKFSNAPGYTFAAQASAIRQLNALVTIIDPEAGIEEFIAGLYAPKLVTDPTAVANPDYVPADWKNARPGIEGTSIYNGVVKVGCRTCHMSASNPSLDFADEADFASNIALIKADVCSAKSMPHAERVMKKFWQSGARAYLITAYPPMAYPDPHGGCAP